jgi:uncharacterized protein YjbI with pentapeptide repeats
MPRGSIRLRVAATAAYEFETLCVVATEAKIEDRDAGSDLLRNPRLAPTCPADMPLYWRSLAQRTLALLLSLAASWFIPAAPALAAMDVAKQVLIGADFSAQDLRGATFNLTNLRDASFAGSDLQGASLFGAKLQDADLSNTNLREATLDSAIFDGTNLTNAVLEDAFAFNTKFTNVAIEGADFTNVPLRGDALKTLCGVASGTNPVTGRDTRASLGCG